MLQVNKVKNTCGAIMSDEQHWSAMRTTADNCCLCAHLATLLTHFHTKSRLMLASVIEQQVALHLFSLLKSFCFSCLSWTLKDRQRNTGPSPNCPGGKMNDQLSNAGKQLFSALHSQPDLRLLDWIQFILKRFSSLTLMKCKYLR